MFIELKLYDKSVDHTRQAYGSSIHSVCGVIGISGTMYHDQPNETKDDAAIEAIQSVVEQRPDYGFSVERLNRACRTEILDMQFSCYEARENTDNRN